MARLTINKATTDKSGNAIAAGAIIGFDQSTAFGSIQIAYSLTIYKSVADYQAGKNQLLLTEIPNNGIYHTATQAEYDSWNTEAGTITKFCTYLKNALIATGNFIDADLTIVI